MGLFLIGAITVGILAATGFHFFREENVKPNFLFSALVGFCVGLFLGGATTSVQVGVAVCGTALLTAEVVGHIAHWIRGE